MKKAKFISILLTVAIILSPSGVFAAVMGKTNISSSGAFIMDFTTGEELYSYNPDSPRAPASMTKIMTLYVVLEAIHNGEINYDTTTRISTKTYNISQNSVYQSVLPLDYGTDYRVDDLMNVVLVYSACGAALALAELVSGSETAFVKRMNDTAWRMGIDAQYFDCMGIANNQVTPRAMANLARNIITDYPEILTLSKQKSVKFHGRTYSTTNKLLNSYYYKGADGLKTGTTGLAGYCFCGTAERDGERVITVTMASSSGSQRFVDTRLMLDYGFSAISKNKCIYTTDTRTYINGAQIPCFYTKKDGGYAVILAEDLHAYGYGINYVEDDKTLYVTHNPQKAHCPIIMDYYNSLTPMKSFMKYYEPSAVRIVIRKDNVEFEVENTLMLDGYTAIPVDALQKVCTSFGYNADTKTINIEY